MTEETFWNLIEDTHRESEGNPDGQALIIEDRLIEMEEEEILSFVKHLQSLMAKSYTAYLWAACFLVNGDSGEDTFEGFRAWILAHGKEFYEIVQENPDAVFDKIDADTIDDDFRVECPGLIYAGFSAWEEVSEKDPAEIPLEFEPVDLVGDFDPDSWDGAYLETEFPLLYEILG